MIWYYIYLTAIGLTPGGSITRHIYNKQYTQYIESTILVNAGRAPSLRVIPWHLPYNWGKSTEKTSVRVAQYKKNEQAQRTNTIQEQQQAPHKDRSTVQEHEPSQYKNNEQAPEPWNSTRTFYDMIFADTLLLRSSGYRDRIQTVFRYKNTDNIQLFLLCL